MKISRRNFLRSTGLACAIYPFSEGIAAPFHELGTKAVTDWRTREIPTICTLCPSRCLMIGRVNGRKLIGLYGNKKDQRTDGKLCARGYAASKMLYDPDRLKYPLKRVGERGEGKWVRVGWGEAIDTIFTNLEKVLKQSGPEGIGLFANGPSSQFIRELFNELTITNISNSSAEYCQQDNNYALQATFGTNNVHSVSKNMSKAKCLVLFGSHFGENVQADLIRDFQQALASGAKLIVIDPRTSVVAAKADFHLMIRPGTDTALLLGWIQYILENGFYNKKFITENSIGLDFLQKQAAEYSLEKVAAITDIPLTEIRHCADLLASNAPDTLIYPGNFSAWYGNDSQRLRAMTILNVLLSDLDSFKSFQTVDSADKRPLPASKHNLFLANRSAVSSSTIIREAGKGKIKLLGCWGQNPFQSVPNPYRTKAAFKNASFTFACDILPTETTLFADIILPEATFLERMDVIEEWFDNGQQITAMRFPLLKPFYESKDPYWIVKQLSSRFGVGKKFDFDDIEARLDFELRKRHLSVSRLKQNDGVISLSHNPLPPQSGELRFPTPSGKIEIYSEKMIEYGGNPVPNFTATPLPPRGYIRLLNGKSPVQYGTACNNRWLNHEIGENELWLNDKVAKKLNIKNGERLFLENIDGIRSLQPVKLKVTAGIRADCVFLAHGFGADSPFLKEGFQRGVADGSLMTRTHPDPVSGSRGIRVNFVRFIKNGIPLDLPQLDSPPIFLEEKTRWWFDSFGSHEMGHKRKHYV